MSIAITAEGNHHRALMFMAAYAFGQSCIWVIVRLLSDHYAPEFLVFCRNFFGLLAILPLLRQRGLSLFHTRRPWLHGARGLVACVGVYSLFYALSAAPLASVVAITYAAPIFTGVVAVALMGERLTPVRAGAIVIGFVGMLLVVQPSLANDSLFGIAAAFLGAVMTAAAFITVKLLSRSEDPGTMVAMQFLILLPVSFVLALPHWQWPTLGEFALMALMGLGFTLAQAAMARAFALADAMVVLPMDFLRLVVATIAAFLLFGEMPQPMVWGGAMLILGGAVVAASHQNRPAALPVKVPGPPATGGPG